MGGPNKSRWGESEDFSEKKIDGGDGYSGTKSAVVKPDLTDRRSRSRNFLRHK